MSEIAKDCFSTKHPHEPNIPPTYDTEGRCLVCVLIVQLDKCKTEVAKLESENKAWRELGEELNKAREHRAIARTRKVFEMLDALLTGVE